MGKFWDNHSIAGSKPDHPHSQVSKGRKALGADEGLKKASGRKSVESELAKEEDQAPAFKSEGADASSGEVGYRNPQGIQNY